MSDAWKITLLCLVYLIASPCLAWWVQTHYKGTLLDKVVTVLATPGSLVVLLVAAPLSIPYFWLYPEQHRTTMDAHGSEAEKQALADYRAVLKRETLWHRLLFRTGIRGPSENRRAAEVAIARVWQDYHQRIQNRATP